MITVQNKETGGLFTLTPNGYTAPKSRVMTDSETYSKEFSELLDDLFRSFSVGLRFPKAVRPRDYLKEKGLDYNKINVGFNSGQFHHRTSDEFKQPYVRAGVLTASEAPVKEEGMRAYTCFGNYAIIFSLRDEKGNTVNFYAIRIKIKEEKAEYLNGFGIYPEYPNELTKRLYVTQTVMDAACILQSGVLENREAVMSLHEGKWMPQHERAIARLKELEEIILVKN